MKGGLGISIGANLVLLGIVTVLLRRDGTANVSAPSVTPSAEVPVQLEMQTFGRSRVDNALSAKPEGTNLTPSAVAELERMGFSRDAIVNAVINDHTGRHDRRVRMLQRKYAPRPVPRREMIALSRDERAERIRELKDALGVERYEAWDKENTLRILNVAGVPMDAREAEEAYRLQKELDEKNQALEVGREDGIIDGADADVLFEKNRQEADRKLEELLGPERFAAMRGAPDPIAEVNRRFEPLSPTPEQARTVLQTERDFHAREHALFQRLRENPEHSGDLANELKAMTDARDEDLRRIFGAQQYDAVKRQNDPTYQALQHNADAWNLGESDVRSVYATVSAFHDQADLARMAAQLREAAGRPVDWGEINAHIDQMRQQTAAGLAGLVGDERVRRMIQNGLLASRDSEIKK